MKIRLEHPAAGGPLTAPGRIILVERGQHDFVVWWHNLQDGGKYRGGYHRTYAEAVTDFAKRLMEEAQMAERVGFARMEVRA